MAEPRLSSLPMASSDLSRTSLAFAVLFTAALLLGFLAWCSHMGFADGADFASFYTAGKIVADGRGAELYDPRVQAQYQREIFGRSNLLPYYHPAFEALLFAPLALLPYSAAYLGWAAINVSLLMAVPFLLRPFVRAPKNMLGMFLLSFLFLPVWIALLQGQDSILLLVLMLLALRSLSGDEEAKSGLWLSAAMFKFQFALPLIVLLGARSTLKFLAGAIAGGVAVLGVSTAVTGLGGQVAYARFFLETNRRLAWATIEPHIMPNLRGFIDGAASRFLAEGPVVAIVILLSVLLMVCGLVLMHAVRRQRGNLVLQFSFAILVTLAVSYHLNPHDLTVLLAPLLLCGQSLMSGTMPGSPKQTLFMTCIILALYLPLTMIELMRFQKLNLEFLLIAGLGVTLGMSLAFRSRAGEDAGSDPPSSSLSNGRLFDGRESGI